MMTFVACFAMMFASCNKELELNGTTWTASQTLNESYTEAGIEITTTMTTDCTMKFIDATKGSLAVTIYGSTTYMGHTYNSAPETQEEAFTYTFDGATGTLTAVDEETGEHATIPFTYNKSDKTIHIDISEPGEDGEPDFELNLVFTQEK